MQEGRPEAFADHSRSWEPLDAPGVAGQRPGAASLASIETELSTLAAGRRIDLRTAQDLSRYFRDEVVRAAEVQYAA